MRKVALVLVLMFAVSIMSAAGANPIPAENAAKQVVLVPFINSTEEEKDYIAETVQEKYKEQFSNVKYQTVGGDTVTQLLTDNHFDPANKELPDNELLIKIGQETGADYVVAMEIMHFINSRHVAYFSTSAKSEVKMRYKVYAKSTNRVTAFQVTGKGNNKVTSIGVPGIGTAMKRGIAQAMDEAYLKIDKL